MLITFWFIKCIKATTYTFLLCNNDNLNGMQCQIDILWFNFSKKYYDAVTRMAWVQTEKLALQMTVNFHGQLGGTPSRPVRYTTTTQHHTHKTLPSITCTFYTQSRCILAYCSFMILHQPTAVWDELKTYHNYTYIRLDKNRN